MIDKKKLKSYNYLKNFPIPFLEDLVRGQVIPFIGAGFSKNAEIPKGKEMPDWLKLGELIAEDLPSDYGYTGPVEAISTYEQEFSRTKLVEKFNELLLTGIIKPGKAHVAFAKIPFELVCTTNFDFLIEGAYDATSIYCRPVIDEEHLAINNLSKKDVSLLKIHGDLHHPKRLIATEEDYDGFLSRFPMLATFLANLLITKTCLFVGYSLDDPDFRQIWQLIKDRLGKLRRHAYVLSVGALKQSILKYERRGVKVINVPFNSKKGYAEILEEVFVELKEFWLSELTAFATVTDEDTKIQLSIDSDTYSRLCFFSVPIKYISIYKKYIFPIVQSYDFVPITVDEFIQSGDNILATISSLAEKASIIIAELTSEAAKKEAGLLLANGNDKKTLFIIEDYEPLSNSFLNAYNMTYLHRDKDFLDNIDEFATKFEAVFRDIATSSRDRITTEARRLLNKNEYVAAVISAVTLFEDVLRRVFVDDSVKPGEFITLSKLLDLAYKKQLINFEQMNELKQWVNIRNKFVHTAQRQITKSQATKIITSIERVIANIEVF